MRAGAGWRAGCTEKVYIRLTAGQNFSLEPYATRRSVSELLFDWLNDFCKVWLYLALPAAQGPRQAGTSACGVLWLLAVVLPSVYQKALGLSVYLSLQNLNAWRMLQQQRTPPMLCVQLDATLCLITVCGKRLPHKNLPLTPGLGASPAICAYAQHRDWRSPLLGQPGISMHVTQPTAGAHTHLNVTYTHRGRPPVNTTLSETPALRAKPQSTLTPSPDAPLIKYERGEAKQV